MKNTLLVVVAIVVAFVATSCGSEADDAESSASGGVPYDMAFIDAMVPHHREAIKMAVAAQDRGLTQPDLRLMAYNIIASQQLEIDRMLEWREKWFGSRTLGPVNPEVLGVPERDLGMDHTGGDEIAAAADVDEKFAQLMIPHHQGAIAMAEEVEERGEHPELKQLATAITVAQMREIEILERHASGEHHG